MKRRAYLIYRLGREQVKGGKRGRGRGKGGGGVKGDDLF